ncbi:MAG: hypothetical protein AB1589_32545 [Cyanobacteriota bacterium]
MLLQKFNVHKRQLVYTILVLALVGIPNLVLSLEQQPEFNCPVGDLLPLEPETYKTHPIKLRVKPWRGQHNVYAIFMIPKDYKHGRLGVLDIKDVAKYDELVISQGKWHDGIQAKPGYYLVKIFVKTRVALKWTAKGDFISLRQPCNWTLTYSK